MAPFIKASLKKNKENSSAKKVEKPWYIEEPVFLEQTIKDVLNSPSFNDIDASS